jgi:hypothetical protein
MIERCQLPDFRRDQRRKATPTDSGEGKSKSNENGEKKKEEKLSEEIEEALRIVDETINQLDDLFNKE